MAEESIARQKIPCTQLARAPDVAEAILLWVVFVVGFW